MISGRYGEITRALNLTFRETESRTANTLRVGSIGRSTAIDGVSDLDMLYIMPQYAWADYNRNGGQYLLLRDTADAIKARYRSTDIRVDRLVVQVLYQDAQVEVQPVFEGEGGDLIYPDSYDGGRWKVTKPRLEIQAMREASATKNDNLRRLCKITRAWRNRHGIAMGGLLIDTLAYRFLQSTTYYDTRSYSDYDSMTADFFSYLAGLERQDYFLALGSNQRVRVKKHFQSKAGDAYQLALSAISSGSPEIARQRWRKIFGRRFPMPNAAINEAFVTDGRHSARNTEEFIEDRYHVDIRYPIEMECEVTQNGFRSQLLRHLLGSGNPLRPQKKLRFFVKEHDIPGNFQLFWKVLNRGPEAIRLDEIRGKILPDEGHMERTETTSFRGDHIVECYAVQHGRVVAKDRIHVPIQEP